MKRSKSTVPEGWLPGVTNDTAILASLRAPARSDAVLPGHDG